MTNVSKRKLKPRVLQKIKKQFVRVIALAKNQEQAHDLATSLLTEAEQLMLAKRLAVVVMLEYGYTFRDIEKTLRVSSTTVATILDKKQEGLYAPIETQCKQYRSRRSSNDSFLDFLEVLLQAGMPPQGKGRWKHVFSHVEK